MPFEDDLLAILPLAVDGLALTPDRETAATVGADPDIALVARGLAYAIAVEPLSGEFAIVSVVRLEPGVFDEEFWRDWRDSFDEGACSQASGVVGHGIATIGEHVTYIGTCEGGVRTYHVAIPDDDILVSVSAVGERRLGEKVIDGLSAAGS